jgi:para-nitrobenzyl esterase
MKSIWMGLALVVATAAASAQPVAQRLHALAEFPPKDGAHLSVSSPAFADGADIPFENTQYRGNVFPGLAWTAGPQGTQSYVIIMQDPDAHRDGAPILHWTLYDIPASVTKLDPAMPAGANPQGSHYGPNARGNAQPYMGPHTPPGAKHHYHLQVFALDTSIPQNDAMSYDMLTEAMRGHILASGEVVGLGQADPAATPMMAPAPVNAPAPSPRPRRTG